MKRIAPIFLLSTFFGCATASSSHQDVWMDLGMTSEGCIIFPDDKNIPDLKLENVSLVRWSFGKKEEVIKIETFRFKCGGNINCEKIVYTRQNTSLWLVQYFRFDSPVGLLTSEGNKIAYFAPFSSVYELQKDDWKCVGVPDSDADLFELIAEKYNFQLE